MPPEKFLKPKRPLDFDEAMRRLVKMTPEDGKKTKRKAAKKKRKT